MTRVPPASGAIVMGTGIVSFALALDRQETVSRLLLAIAIAAWAVLGLVLTGQALSDFGHVRREVRSPAALTAVAATAVVGSRLALVGWDWAGDALLAVALALWVILLGPVLGHRTNRTTGVSLLLTVSTESLAALAGLLAGREHTDWLLYAALGPFLLGLAFYALVIARFDLGQLGSGRGDHWITGGALAISTLAAASITVGAAGLHVLTGVAGALRSTSIILWILTMAWLPVLLAAEVVRPRLGYDLQRWSTVFPFGMYAACSFGVGSAVHAAAINQFARIWVWIAAAVWLVVFGAMLRRSLAR